MKVVQLLPDLDGGGVERGTLEVAEELVKRGHESIVISAGGRMVKQLEAEGSRHVTWDLGTKSFWTFRHVWALRRWLKQEKPDILHVRSRLPAWIAWFAWKGMNPNERPRLVTTVHGLYSVSKYSGVMCKGERVIAVSKTVEAYIRNNYPETDMGNVRLVYRGIDPQEFPLGYQPSEEWLEKWRSDFPQLEGKKVITLAGRLTRLKGHNDLIDMIKVLVAQGMPVHALIVGGEDAKRKAYAEELYSRVNDEGLSEHITFTGARSDIRDIYSVSDLVLSLSTKPESFGRTVAEAIGQGVPVVGYDHGGVGEILTALYPLGKTPLNDADQLVKTVSEVLESGVRPHGNPEFLKTTMLDKTLAVYGELVNDFTE
ncbi:glycosyltransferase family 4 protein [Pontibacterium sp.]|uniref:glycosyltransferase family 4 protein n=1 Tax=Pontibacterium sp. TaxID=2036026 RepID=UPI003519B10B